MRINCNLLWNIHGTLSLNKVPAKQIPSAWRHIILTLSNVSHFMIS